MNSPREIAIGVALVLATLALYAPVAQFDFVALDDDVYVSANEVVLSGLSADGVVWAFSTRAGGNWHPLTWLSHMLDVEIGGSDPTAHHLTSVLLHAVNAVLLYLVLLSSTGRCWRAAVVAGLFALHPLNVESVAWIAERKTLLCMSFGLLSTLAYLAYARKGGAGRYLLSLSLLALGLMSKPMLVTLPVAFLLLDYWPLCRTGSGRIRALVVEKLPFLLLSVAASAMTLAAQAAGGALVATAGQLPLTSRLANAAVSYVRYLRKLVWPDDLAVLYQHPDAPGGVAWSDLQVLGAIVLLVGLSWGVYALRGRRYLTLGWLWFLGTLVPMIGIVQVGEQAMADRYAYLPMIGLLSALVWGAADLVERIAAAPRAVPVAATLAGLCLAGYASAGRQQLHYWQDSVALFRRGLELSPDNQTLNFNLGTALEARGRFVEAQAHYRRALEVGSVSANEHWGMASALRGEGRLDQAVEHFRQAVAIDPTKAGLQHAMADTLAAAGRHGEAVGHYEAALRADPTLAAARSNLGSAWLRLGDVERAAREFAEALRIDPTLPEAQNNLAAALIRSGDAGGALKHFLEAGRLRPDWHVPWSSAAHILATHEDPAIRNPAEAIRLAQRAAALSGEKDPWSLHTLSLAYSAEGRFDQAVRSGERALEAARAAGLADLADEILRRLARDRQSAATGPGTAGE